MDMESRRKMERTEGGTNPEILPIRTISKSMALPPLYMDSLAYYDQTEIGNWSFSVSMGGRPEGEALSLAPVVIDLDFIRTNIFYRQIRRSTLLRRKMAGDDEQKMLGYHDSVDSVREFLDST